MLSTHVPEGDLHISKLEGLHVEPDGGNGGHELSLLQLEKDGGLARTIQAQRYHSHLHLHSGKPFALTE